MAYISTTFTGTPAECVEHFDKVCASYHPSGYGTRITSVRVTDEDGASEARQVAEPVELLRKLDPQQSVTITIGRYDSAD